MAEEKVTLRDVNFRDLFPWLAVFRSFELARDFKKILLAAAGVLVMAGGWFWLAALFRWVAPHNEPVRVLADQVEQCPWGEGRWAAYSVSGRRGLEIVDGLLEEPLYSFWKLATNWEFVTQPADDFVRPFQMLFSGSTGWWGWVFALLCAVWAVVVWAFFGGAITRIAALQFARDERISLRESIRFARQKYLSFLGGPLIPLLFIAGIAFFCFLGGLVTAIPWVGPVFAGSLWFLPLVAGFLMALVIIGWAVGWPLMFPTVSVEGSDTFDAVSRAYAYVFQRPWRFIFYVLAAIMFGSLCSYFVVLLADLLVYLARWSVSLGLLLPANWGAGPGAELTKQLAHYGPWATGWNVSTLTETPKGAVWLGSVFTAFWLYLVFTLLVAFVYSYFWSAATIIYCLLRKDVDNIEVDEVYVESEEEGPYTPPPPAEAEEPAPATAEAGTAAAPEGGQQPQGTEPEQADQPSAAPPQAESGEQEKSDQPPGSEQS